MDEVLTATILHFPAMAQTANLPNRIREQRKARGLTLRQVADKIGCGEVMLSDLERGNRRLNTYWMERIAGALEVEQADLLPEGDNGFSLSADERDMVRRYRAASPAAQAQIRALFDVMAPPVDDDGEATAA